MKVKVLSRNPDEYTRETKKDIHKRKSSNIAHSERVQYYGSTVLGFPALVDSIMKGLNVQ